MKHLLILPAHLLTTVARHLGPGGARAVVANSLLMKQQLLVIHRSRRRAPNPSTLDRFLFGFWSLFLTTIPVFISRWMGAHLLLLMANINHYPQN